MKDPHAASVPPRPPAILIAMLIALCALLLQSCAGGQKLTASTAPAGKTPPPITLVDMKGMPQAKAQMLTDLVAEAAGRRDIAIVQGAFADGYRLDGAFTAAANSGATVLSYEWRLADATGVLVHSFSGAETAGAVSGDPWGAAVPEVMRRIAEATAANLALRLAELGYAVRTGALFGIDPPLAVAQGRLPARVNLFRRPVDRGQTTVGKLLGTLI